MTTAADLRARARFSAALAGASAQPQHPTVGRGDDAVLDAFAAGLLAGAHGQRLALTNRSLPIGGITLCLEFDGQPVAATIDTGPALFDPDFTGADADRLRDACRSRGMAVQDAAAREHWQRLVEQRLRRR